jgi:hypothetical protein
MATAQIEPAEPARPEQAPEEPRAEATIKLVPGGSRGPIQRTAAAGSGSVPDAAGPVWLELYLEIERLGDTEDRKVHGWFEGSVSPWGELHRPVVRWDAEAAAELAQHGLTAPHPARAEAPGIADATRVLALLPHLYSLGVARVVQELVRKGKSAIVNGLSASANGAAANGHGPPAEPLRVELFPLVGFFPDRCSDPWGRPIFRTLRTNVAVIGETILTIRLPDLRCPPEPGRRRSDVSIDDAERATADPLEIPSRFFPCWDAQATDFAEEIARHQAATARFLSEEVRSAMPVAEHDSRRRRRGRRAAGAPLDDPDDARVPDQDKRDDPDDARVPDQDKLDDLVHLGEISEMADRQLSRLLRRLGSYGEQDDDGVGSASDIRRRYHYAVDEIRSLERELLSAGDRLRTHMETRFQATVAFAGSAILIPTLVAGIFGANVWIPGERHREGLFALLLFIFAFATLGGLVMDAVRSRRHSPSGLVQWVFAGLGLAAVGVAITILALGPAGPRVTIDTPKSKAGVEGRSVRVAGHVRPGQQLRVVSVAPVDPTRAAIRDVRSRDGDYSASVPVQPGTNEICVTPLKEGRTVCVSAVGAHGPSR